MSTTLSMWLGIAFVVLAIVAVILQAWLWSFPMEPDPGGPDPNGKSSAPRVWVNMHRLVGLAYVVIYVFMMWHMLPRLWEYQVELPARTVMHACMAICIGVLLVTKIAIIRWFQHFGTALPGIGLGLLTCTMILAMLSLPFAIKAHGFDGTTFAESNLQRVKLVLSGAGMGAGVDSDVLATPEQLTQGREILTRKCSFCHDMRTILVKPRTGASWYKLALRMQEKPTLGPPLTDEDVRQVTAFLVAISPDIQSSIRLKRKGERERKARLGTVTQVAQAPSVGEKAAPKVLSAEEGQALLEAKCTECHELDDVQDHGGDDLEGWTAIVKQMVEEEEADLTPEDAHQVIAFLAATYPKE
jgi:cytochrome c5